MDIVVFADGSSSTYKDKRFGGYGVYFEDPKNHKHNVSRVLAGDNPTNQRAELKACIEAITKCYKNFEGSDWNLTIFTDSMYVIKIVTEWAPKWILNGWKRRVCKKFEPVCNLDLVKKLYTLSRLYPVKYKHVKAHCKEPSKECKDWKLWYGNDKADQLANTAMNKARDKFKITS